TATTTRPSPCTIRAPAHWTRRPEITGVKRANMQHQHTMAASTAGSVVIDVGGDVGALVLYVPANQLGREIEVSRTGSGEQRTHAAVRERRVATGSRYCVVYATLAAGEYTVWSGDDDTPTGTVTVVGGRVTEVDWSAVF